MKDKVKYLAVLILMLIVMLVYQELNITPKSITVSDNGIRVKLQVDKKEINEQTNQVDEVKILADKEASKKALIEENKTFFLKTKGPYTYKEEKAVEVRQLTAINEMNLEEWTHINGIGQVIGQRIITYRQSEGDFKNIEGLLNVKGIGEKKYTSIVEQL